MIYSILYSSLSGPRIQLNAILVGGSEKSWFVVGRVGEENFAAACEVSRPPLSLRRACTPNDMLRAQSHMAAAALLLLLLLPLAAAVASEDSGEPSLGVYPDVGAETLVNLTGLGQIQGVLATQGTNYVYRAFRGVPFAQAPTGALRFQPTKPVEPWAPAVKDASQFGNICTQRWKRPKRPSGTNFDVEDCLYLNVYTPRRNASRPPPAGGFPVWVYMCVRALRPAGRAAAEQQPLVLALVA
jgi:hypothetical protein|eukprot:COSAG06_NODE_1014_length_11069_cov_244.892160_9_plen_242_part_00